MSSKPKDVRIPPHNLDSEQFVLGCVVLDQSIMNELIQVIVTSDFYRPAHQKIYSAMLDMYNHGEAIDSLSVCNYLECTNQLEESGGKLYILDLPSMVSTTLNWKTHADIVHEKSQYRKILELGAILTGVGYEAPHGEVDDAINFAVSTSTALALNSSKQVRTTDDIVASIMSDINAGERSYITPYGVRDARIEKGDLVVTAAGTSVGKTAITLEWADHWSEKHQVTYFEYEMKEEQLISRLISKHSGIPLQRIKDGDLTPDDIAAIEDASNVVKSRNLRVEEVWCDNTTLFAKIRREAQNGTEIVIIDHLGLIPFTRGGGNEAKAIGVNVTNPLKRLASELNIIIVLLVQLNREGQKDVGFPKLYHLRDSGEIEQDASIVLMMWSERQIKDEWSKRVMLREKSGVVATDENLDDSFYLFRVSIEKNRNGNLGESYALYRGETFNFDFRGMNSDSVETFVNRKMFN